MAFALTVLALTAIFTLVDRKVPGAGISFLYREKLWQNMLVNFVMVAIISSIASFLIWNLLKFASELTRYCCAVPFS